MGIAYTFISGVSIGFELLTTDAAQMIDEEATWGICFDFLILRIMLIF